MGWESLQWTDVRDLHHGTASRAWRNILKTGTIPGYIDPSSQRDKHHTPSQRSEAFFSSSTYLDNVQKNPHTSVESYKFNNYKNEVELVINMEIATKA
eukprot:2679020-Pyramimonas_sp.AAC.1